MMKRREFDWPCCRTAEQRAQTRQGARRIGVLSSNAPTLLVRSGRSRRHVRGDSGKRGRGVMMILRFTTRLLDD
jgi:hypothetical protein